ncbi:MAG: hypothetical protein ACXW0L_05665 [Methylosarcina sp.]
MSARFLVPTKAGLGELTGYFPFFSLRARFIFFSKYASMEGRLKRSETSSVGIEVILAKIALTALEQETDSPYYFNSSRNSKARSAISLATSWGNSCAMVSEKLDVKLKSHCRKTRDR